MNVPVASAIRAYDFATIVDSGSQRAAGSRKRNIDRFEYSAVKKKPVRSGSIVVDAYDPASIVDSSGLRLGHARRGEIKSGEDSILEKKSVANTIRRITADNLAAVVDAKCNRGPVLRA